MSEYAGKDERTFNGVMITPAEWDMKDDSLYLNDKAKSKAAFENEDD